MCSATKQDWIDRYNEEQQRACDAEEENVMLRDVLDEWVEWEARMLNTREVWNDSDGLPHFTQKVYEDYATLQKVRNDAIKKSNG